MCGVCITTERLQDLQKAIQTKQAHHLQNQNRKQTQILLIFFFFLSSRLIKKKTAAQVLSSRNGARVEQEGLSSYRSQAIHLIDIRARVRRERFRSCKLYVKDNVRAGGLF